MGQLVLENLAAGYDSKIVAENLTLTVENGALVSLLGPSGAGKTTILKTVAGLLPALSGRIRIDGRDIHEMPAEKRNVVMVFQKPLLFPFLNVFDNVAFGLRMKGRIGRKERRSVYEILEKVRLSGFGPRRVEALSGGQQQRVSLARALVLQPAALLLDEPFSQLDLGLRREMRDLLLSLQAETHVTTLFVTHDQSEALTLSREIALLLHGRIRQTGPPRVLFHKPADREVAEFFGGVNFFQGTLENHRLKTAFGEFPVVAQNEHGKATATIRPEDVALSFTPNSGIPGVVRDVRFEGAASRYIVELTGGVHITAAAPDLEISPGDRVFLSLPSRRIHLFT